MRDRDRSRALRPCDRALGRADGLKGRAGGLTLRRLGPTVKPADLRTVRPPRKVAEAFYFSAEWKALRAACLKRDGHRCVLCGEPAIVADHITGRRRWLAEGMPGSPDVLDNLRSLCRTHDNRFKEGADGQRRGGDARR